MKIGQRKLALLLGFVIGVILTVGVIAFLQQAPGAQRPKQVTVKQLYQEEPAEMVSLEGTVVQTRDNSAAVIENGGYAINVISSNIHFEDDLKINQRISAQGLFVTLPEGYHDLIANSVEVKGTGHSPSEPKVVSQEFITEGNKGRWVTLKDQTLVNTSGPLSYDFGYPVYSYSSRNLTPGESYDLVGFVSYYNEPQLNIIDATPSQG